MESYSYDITDKLKYIFEELEEAVCRKFRHTASCGDVVKYNYFATFFVV